MSENQDNSSENLTPEPDFRMPDVARPLHVVVEHRTGLYAGLSQIVGTTADLSTPWPINEALQRPDGLVAVGLVKQKRGGLYYREIVVPENMGRFNEGQV
jgi:hypothetical protein